MVSIDDVKIVNVLADDKNFCKNWRSFCRALGFGNDILHDLERMDTHSSSIQDIIINIFGYCKSVYPLKFTAKTFSEKLREIGCAGSAGAIESLCGYGEDTQGKSGLIWFNVRPPTRFYAGREEEMEIIDEQWVECLEKKMLLFVAITGLGGIGKSELAANYAKHFHESTKGHCIWVDAESNQTLLQSFQNLANSGLMIPLTDESGGEKELHRLVQEIHAKITDKDCLYIFDNLDTYEQPTIQQLKDLTSKQRPSVLRPFVLMTSRYQPALKYFGRKCKALELDILKDESAIKFFCDYFEIKENEIRDAAIKEVIQRLCQRLKCFPLAMQQAAAYINENLSHGSERDTAEVQGEVAEYLEKLEIETKKLLNYKIPDESHTTFLTWGITMEKICKMTDGGMEAIKLMNIISFMTPDNISVEFLLKIFDGMEWNIFEMLEDEPSLSLNEDALQILHDHSMVKVQRRKSLSVHRLVQEVTRIKLKEGTGWKDTLAPLLKIVQVMMIKKEIKLDQLIHVQRIWKHATENADLTEEHGEFPVWIAMNLSDSGKYRETYDFSCQTLSTLESTLGENHRCTLKIKKWKGAALNSLAEYVKALDVLSELYEKQKELFGEEDYDCLNTANDIGLVHWKLEKYEEALKWFRNALEKRERIFGKEHPETLTLKHNIAGVLNKQGKYKAAIELYDQVLEVKERLEGKGDLSTLTTKHNVATVKFGQGNYEDALEIFQEILQAMERKLIVDHPHALTTKGWIARTYVCLGRKKEAVELFKETLKKEEEILGAEHPQTLTTKNNLATVRFNQGEYLDALKNFEEVLAGHERVLGGNHPDTLTTKFWIAETYRCLERNEEASELYKEVLEQREEILGPEHPQTLTLKHNLAVTRYKQEAYSDALKIFQEILEMRKRVLGVDHPSTVETKKWTTHTYEFLERVKARQRFKKAKLFLFAFLLPFCILALYHFLQ